MPLYEYQCEKCGGQFEVMQKFSDVPLSVHEACGGSVHRLLSAPALQFKGSGWYVTDYAKSGKQSNGSSDKGESSSDSKASSSESGTSTEKAATSSEKKPASSTEKS